MRQGFSGLGPTPHNGGDAKKENHGKDYPMEGKSDQMIKFDLGALDLFLSPTKDSPAPLSPVESMSIVEAYQKRGESKMRVAFLGAFSEEE